MVFKLIINQIAFNLIQNFLFDYHRKPKIQLFPYIQCYHIWRFIANLATFDTILLLKFSFGYLAFLSTFLATFKKLVKNWFWLDLIMLWCIYFCLLKELWCRYFRFLKVLLGFSIIWLLFAQTFWQHWLFQVVFFFELLV